MNTAAKLYIVCYAQENVTLCLGTVRDNDSATKCHRRDPWQLACGVDPECPPCTVMQLSVEGLDGLHTMAVLAEFIVGMMPHRQIEDSPRVQIIRSRDYGHFHETNLDRNIFRDRRGTKSYSLAISGAVERFNILKSIGYALGVNFSIF